MNVAETLARDALNEFVRRSLVLITFTPQGQRTPAAASGTLIVGRTGRLGVLTAGHAFPEGQSHVASVVTRNRFFEDAIEFVRRTPPRDDVAVAFVRERWAGGLVDDALSLDHVEDEKAQRLDSGTQLIVAGFPKQFTYDAATHNGVEHRFPDNILYTRRHRHDDRRLSIDWKDRHLSRTDVPFDSVKVSPGRLPPTKPLWLSGGPVFRVRSTRPGFVWSPLGDSRLIGVAIEYTKGCRELATPWWRWNAWLRATIDAPQDAA